MKRALATVVAIACAVSARDAIADTPYDTAQSLFDEAKVLVENGRWSDACPKLERSFQIEPNMVTVYRLADCHEHVGLLASAWTRYLEAASFARAAGASQRYEAAMARVAALEPTLARVRIDVPKSMPDGTVVANDGHPIARTLWGTNVPVDAGSHEIEVSAPGKISFHQTYKIVDGAVAVVDVPPLADAAPAAPRPAIPVAPAPEPEPGTGATRTTGAVAVVVGVVAIGVSVGLGFAAKAKDRQAEDECLGARCNETGKRLSDDARALGNAGTIVFVAGAAVAVTGVVLWIVGANKTPPRASTVAWSF